MKMMKKNGTIILETMIYIFIAAVIVMHGIKTAVVLSRNYIKMCEDEIQNNDINNFIINLNYDIEAGKVLSICARENKIFIEEENEEIKNDGSKEKIKVKRQKIIEEKEDTDDTELKDVAVRYFETNTVNNIIYKVKSFQAVQKGKIIYLKITDKNGDKYICSI